MSDLPPADWYTDPEDESQFRYWDGSAWTEHRALRHGRPDASPEPEPGEMRRPGQLIASSLSIARRRWRSCAAAGLIYLAALVMAVVLFIAGGNNLLRGELGEIWDRITDPGFDPQSPEQTAYFESLELDLSVVNLATILLGVVAFWIAHNLLQATVARVALHDLRNPSLSPSGALRQGLRRVPRLVGIDLQVLAMLVVAVFAVVIAESAAPVLLIPLIPALLVAAVFAAVVVSLAYVVASVGPATPALAYSARLVKGRFWRTLVRMLLVVVVLTAASLVAGLIITFVFAFIGAWTGSESVGIQVVSQLAQTVVGTGITIVGVIALAIIYHDLGGESDQGS